METKASNHISITDNIYYICRTILIICLPLTIISALSLSLPHSSADNSSSDNISIKLPVSCTMSGTGNTHSESLINGTYDSNIGNGVTTLTTHCNDKDGYIIYTIGASNNTEGNNNLIGSNGGNIATGTATSGNISNWAMKLASLDNTLAMNSSFTSDFASIPATWTEVAKKESGTKDSETGSSITATYAVYVSNFQPTGTYSGQVKYVMLHPSSMAVPTTLNQAYATAGKSKVTATDPNTGETGSYYTMQDMTTAICDAVNVYGAASETKLIDTRDNKFYYATKLADNHCWMTQNLDFDIDSAKTYTHADTDLGWDPDEFNTSATWTPSTANGKYNIQWTGTNFSGWSNNKRYPYSADPGDAYYYTTGNDNGETKTTLENCRIIHSDCEHYHAGNYYNWTATIAMNDSSSISSGGTNATTSVCPAGWRLPRTSANEFGAVLYEYDITVAKNGSGIQYTTNGFKGIRKTPFYLVRSGVVSNGSLNNPGGRGYYRSSTVYSSDDVYYMIFDKSGVWSASANGRGYGWPVRCLAR